MSDAPASGNKRSPAFIALLAVIAALLVAIVVLLAINLLPKGTPAAEVQTPPATTEPPPTDGPVTPPATPVATPTPTATKTTKPANNGGGSSQPTGPGFTSFSYNAQVTCTQPDPGGPYYSPTPKVIPIKVSWKTVHATEVWFVMGHSSDAAVDHFVKGPASGNQDDLTANNYGNEFDYPCGHASQEYTMTLVGDNGQHITKHWTVKNKGAQY